MKRVSGENNPKSERGEMEMTVYEYCTLRYVPDIERGEFINVGLMMMCKRHRWLRVVIHIDEDRIRALAPRADIGRLRIQLRPFLRDDVPFPALPVEERYRWLAAVKSAIIQTSPSHPGLIPADSSPVEILSSTFDTLFARLVR